MVPRKHHHETSTSKKNMKRGLTDITQVVVVRFLIYCLIGFTGCCRGSSSACPLGIQNTYSPLIKIKRFKKVYKMT